MAAPLLAHGLAGRGDLPVPIGMFYVAASAVLVLSFVLLAFLWSSPWLGSLRGRALGGRTSHVLLSAPLLWAGRVVVLALFLLAVAAAGFGNEQVNRNVAPLLVFVVWWVGIVPLSVVAGNVWQALNPWATLARLARVPARRREWPVHVGLLPAAGLFLVWAWLELVYPTATHMRFFALTMVAYSLYTLAGMVRYGVDEWLEHGETFSVYTRLLASMAPVSAVGTGAQRRVQLRVPFVHALKVRPERGLVLFVTLLIGTVSFDGFSRTGWWRLRSVNAAQTLVEQGLSLSFARELLGTFALLALVLLAYAAFELASFAAHRLGPLARATERVARAFAPSLLPIALAYVVAHYFSFFFFQAQDLVRLASDPFGSGADLFGTRGFEIDYGSLSANLIWYVQVGAIVVGHVLGLVLAHDRALELSTGKLAAVRSQVCMLALMVLYTVGGLYFLSEGLSG